MSSLFGNFLGKARGQQQVGGIGNLAGGLLGSGNNNNQDGTQEQQKRSSELLRF
jgi:hypothetical protein